MFLVVVVECGRKSAKVALFGPFSTLFRFPWGSKWIPARLWWEGFQQWYVDGN